MYTCENCQCKNAQKVEIDEEECYFLCDKCFKIFNEMNEEYQDIIEIDI